MEPFRPIEANNNGQMVPQAESIWEGNYTNAAVARDAKQNANRQDELERAFHPLAQVAVSAAAPLGVLSRRIGIFASFLPLIGGPGF